METLKLGNCLIFMQRKLNFSNLRILILSVFPGFGIALDGIFVSRSFVRDRLLESVRLGPFVWGLSFGILRLEIFIQDILLEKVRLPSFDLKRSFGTIRLETFAWEIWLWDVHLETFAG